MEFLSVSLPALAPWQVAIILVALFLAGIIKGATGAGAPIIAVPVLAAVVDVRFAILMMVAPNLLTNIWQAWAFRRETPERGFLVPYLVAGVIGVVLGTLLLASLSLDVLNLLIGFSVLAYIAFRLARPDWVLSMNLGRKLAPPAGLSAGLLQGSTGLSAPVMLTFLTALRMPRLTFVATVSLVFMTFASTHALALWANGLLTVPMLLLSVCALLPIGAGMAVGSRVLKGLSPKAFDRLVLGLLALVALRIFYEAAVALF